jgi:NAD(P)-dependent dehydrogenase (short-subunit alcohol dehydrogenase family)
LLFAEAGADLVLLDNVEVRVEGVAETVRGMGRRVAVQVADVLDEAEAERAIAGALAAFDGADVLVTIIGSPSLAPLVELPSAAWDGDFTRNLRYVFLASRQVARDLIARGRRGSIVSISSTAGLTSAPGHAAYGAAKAGLIALTRTMAIEWAPHGIRVNTVAPGIFDTPRMPKTDPVLNARVPLDGRPGTTREVGLAALFLASDMASYVTGHALVVDGGVLAKFGLT